MNGKVKSRLIWRCLTSGEKRAANVGKISAAASSSGKVWGEGNMNRHGKNKAAGWTSGVSVLSSSYRKVISFPFPS